MYIKMYIFFSGVSQALHCLKWCAFGARSLRSLREKEKATKNKLDNCIPSHIRMWGPLACMENRDRCAALEEKKNP